MFGGSHLGCKCPLLEPHFGYFLAHSAAMASKMSLMRTQNRPFSPPKHHLPTCSKDKIPIHSNISLANPGIVSEKEWIPRAAASRGRPMALPRKRLVQALLACLLCILGIEPPQAEAPARPRRNREQKPAPPYWLNGLAMLPGLLGRLFKTRGP